MTLIKTDKDAVPKFKFHQVDIRRNILVPNQPLKFIPHFQDLQDGNDDDQKFEKWTEELENMDRTAGFDTRRGISKLIKTQSEEWAWLVSLYLDRWIAEFEGEGLTRATLVCLALAQPENEHVMTDGQKMRLLEKYGRQPESPKSRTAAENFIVAFKRVIGLRKISLVEVLAMDPAAGRAIEVLARQPDSAENDHGDEELEKMRECLAVYLDRGCALCYSHSCEHGYYEATNERWFLYHDWENGAAHSLALRLREQRRRNADLDRTPQRLLPCKNQCYSAYDTGNAAYVTPPWKESHLTVLRSMFVALGEGNIRPQCAIAMLLGRLCWDVYRQMKQMGLTLPAVQPVPLVPIVKPLPWYNRFQKTLGKDWEEHTITHKCDLRVTTEQLPCTHDGPCTTANNCPCVANKLLCESMCRCTADSCAHKFTGCACHSLGKTCYQRQRQGKPCICIQLNRECDPELCGDCGAKKRADSANASDYELHSTGCQNVSLQRGLPKTVLLGKSRLANCGYGLFTAEDILQDEFIIEYTGESISHDEGIRRQSRTGNVFDIDTYTSYVFTLLETEGTWIDAAVHGNLSRYINHATTKDGCNLDVRVLYVTGEFRILFRALRDINAGEELFFDYGENFPNLTQKLLDGEGDEKGGKKKRGGGTGRGLNRPPGRKSIGGRMDKPTGAGARKEAPTVVRVADGDDDDDDDDELDEPALTMPKRRKRKRGDDDSDESEYRPARNGSELDGEFDARGRQQRGKRQRKPTAAAKAMVVEERIQRGQGLDESSDNDSWIFQPESGVGNAGQRQKKPTAAARAVTEDNRTEGVESSDNGTWIFDLNSNKSRRSRKMTNEIAESEEDDDEEWEEDDGGNRRRNRQKPARYRSEE
jgi:hypothetical protein